MFRNLPAAQFGRTEPENEDSLKVLGAAMTADFEKPKDGPDDEESGIPALYTYFGQFIDHDITFDPTSSLQKQNDPDALVDFRTPALDLDNVYGRGPDDQPYLYTKSPNGGAKQFLLGNSIAGADSNARDLPRNGDHPARALIGDPRNDENAIVSQLQGLFLRFHNRVVDEHPDWEFEEVQQWMRFRYQYVVLHDFLERIICPSVLAGLKSGDQYDRSKLKFYHWKNQPFIPVEFSVAAYRLGHSMVRPAYRLNDDVILPIFAPNDTSKGLVGFRAIEGNRAIDWPRFIDLEKRKNDGSDADKKRRLQFAYQIDTSLVNPLSDLGSAVSDPPPSLPQRNLLRGWRLGLPSGQDVARAMGEEPLKDDKILIGKAGTGTPINKVHAAFTKNCPLWTYILAEAAQNAQDITIPVEGGGSNSTPVLGRVGGQIVAETLLGLMFGDGRSYLKVNPNLRSELGKYGLKDFVTYALGK